MKTRLPRHHRLAILALVAAVGGFAPSLQAQWGSVRSSNRERKEPAQVQHQVQAQRRENEQVRHEEEHGRVEHAPVPARVYAPGHEDFEAERRHGYYWGGFRPGVTIGVLPQGYIQLSTGGLGYYYYDGVYFRPTPDGPYAVVAPPVGVVVPQLPDGAQLVVAGGASFYYAGGAFYLPQPGGFAVVPAPLGAMVNSLPPWATAVTINGRIYYMADNTYFMPVMVGGVTAYVTARP